MALSKVKKKKTATAARAGRVTTKKKTVRPGAAVKNAKPSAAKTRTTARKQPVVKAKAAKKREGKPHGYWPRKTERQLIEPLNEDLRDAWSKLRETAESYGEQHIYTSAKAMMFARSRCYAFVRPKKKYLELTILLSVPVESSLLKSARKVSAQKYALIVHVPHGDLLEEPVTDWLRQAFDETPAGVPEKMRDGVASGAADAAVEDEF